MWSAIALAVLIVTGLVVANLNHSRNKAVAKASEWRIQGPSCPIITRSEYDAQTYRARKVFTYDDFQVARVAGHVECDEVHDRGGLSWRSAAKCRFTSPNLIVVTNKLGERIFAPGPGHPATIVVRNGQATCVLASNFRLNR